MSYARKRAAANCSFVVGMAQDLPWPDRSVDVVASTLAAHHIPEAARQDAFGEIYRVLRPGGARLVADFRPSRRRHSLHCRATARRHGRRRIPRRGRRRPPAAAVCPGRPAVTVPALPLA